MDSPSGSLLRDKLNFDNQSTLAVPLCPMVENPQISQIWQSLTAVVKSPIPIFFGMRLHYRNAFQIDSTYFV